MERLGLIMNLFLLIQQRKLHNSKIVKPTKFGILQLAMASNQQYETSTLKAKKLRYLVAILLGGASVKIALKMLIFSFLPENI